LPSVSRTSAWALIEQSAGRRRFGAGVFAARHFIFNRTSNRSYNTALTIFTVVYGIAVLLKSLPIFRLGAAGIVQVFVGLPITCSLFHQLSCQVSEAKE
jgi:hypothetical protein